VVVDTTADRLIVFGGRGNDVWSLPLAGTNENRWVRLFPEGEAPPASEPVSVYDPVQNRVLALLNSWHGVSDDYDRVQLWELSLAGTPRWRHLQPAGASPGREVGSAVLALDRENNRLLVVGETLGRAGTWSLSLNEGGEWTRLADAPPRLPPSFAGSGQFLVFDSARQRLVAFGSEVWEMPLAGREWASLGRYPCQGGPFFSGPAFDEVGERVIFAGGYCGGPLTFSLATNSWQTTFGPSSAFGAAAVDARRERILYAFGSIGVTSNETTQMSLNTLEFEQLTPNTRGAAPSQGSTFVWDPTRGAIVAFGGENNETATRGLEPGATWRALPNTPAATGWAADAIYDPVRSAIVAFGGTDHPDTVYLLGSKPGANWEPLTVPSAPEPRRSAAASYDSTEQRVLIHGGSFYPFASGNEVDETWALSLNGEPSWTKLTPRGEGPGARAGELGVYDPVARRFIVYGGLSNGEARQDLHALELAGDPKWSVLEPKGTAPELHSPVAVYDADDHRILFVSIDYFGVIAGALELGETPTWHTFCSLGTPPPSIPAAPNVLLAPDGLFVDVATAAYRFDLATPYCD
jgi:hypothetical protein